MAARTETNMGEQETSNEQSNIERRGEEVHDSDRCEVCRRKRARFVFQRSEEVFDLIGEEYVEQLWVVRHEERLCSECASERAGTEVGADDDEFEDFYARRDDAEEEVHDG